MKTGKDSDFAELPRAYRLHWSSTPLLLLLLLVQDAFMHVLVIWKDHG